MTVKTFDCELKFFSVIVLLPTFKIASPFLSKYALAIVPVVS